MSSVSRHYFGDGAGRGCVRIMMVIASPEMAAFPKQLATTANAMVISRAGMARGAGPIHMVVLGVDFRPVPVGSLEVACRKTVGVSGDEGWAYRPVGKADTDVARNVDQRRQGNWAYHGTGADL